METWVYILIEKRHFITNGIEYTHTTRAKNISLYPSYEKAFEALLEMRSNLNQEGYILGDSDCYDDKFGSRYWCRMEDNATHAVVLEILCKPVHGELFSTNIT